MKVKIQNNRNHPADLAADVQVPALGSVTLEEEKWKEIFAADKYKRMLVAKSFITVVKIETKRTAKETKPSKGEDK